MATEEDLASRPRTLVIIEVTSMVVIALFSILGNTVSCVVMYQNARLRTWHNLLLLNVIITDLLAAVMCMPFVASVLATGRWAIGGVSCAISGYISALLATVSVSCLAVISVSRYYLIARFITYVNIFKQKNVGLMILAIWLASAVCTFPPLVGWGEYVFLPGGALCFLYFGSSISYSTVFTILMMGVPILVMIFCFTKVYLVVKSRRRITPHHHSHKVKAIANEEVSAAKTLLCVVIMVLLCWTPMVVIYALLASGVTDIPRQVSLMTTYMAFLPCAFKPVIYLIMKPQFRLGFLRLVFGRRLQKLLVQNTPTGHGAISSGKPTDAPRQVIRLETLEATVTMMSTTENKKPNEHGSHLA